MPFLMSLAGNKFVWIGLAFAGILAYYNIQVFALEHTVQGLEADVKNLQADIRTVQGNYNTVENINKSNEESLAKYQRDMKKVAGFNVMILDGKDQEIKELKQTIKDLRTIDDYPEELTFEKCKFEIKRITDETNTSTTFGNILNIGF